MECKVILESPNSASASPAVIVSYGHYTLRGYIETSTTTTSKRMQGMARRPKRVGRVHVAPVPPRVVAPVHVVRLPDFGTDTVFYSFTSLQPFCPIATPSFPQLLQNALLPAPRDLSGVRSPGAAALPVDLCPFSLRKHPPSP